MIQHQTTWKGIIAFLRKISYRDCADYTSCENFLWEIRLTRSLLRVVGMWPKEEHINYTKCIVFTLMTTLVIVLPSLASLCLADDDGEVLTLAVTGSVFGYLIISLPMMTYNRELGGSIFEEIRENWANEASANNRRIMHRYARKARTTALLEVAAAVANIISYSSEPFVDALKSNSGKIVKTIGNMWYPFSTSNPYIYGLTYVTQLFTLVLGALVFLAIDFSLILFIFHTCGQLTVLGNKIKVYNGKIKHTSKLTSSDVSLCNCLKCITDHHVRIGKFVKKIDDYFHVVLLARVTISTIHLCCVGFNILKTAQRRQLGEVLPHLIYLVILAMTLFIHCWLGEQCLQRGTSLADIAYSTRWTENDPKVSRCITLMIRQARVPLKITAGKFFVLSLRLYKEYIFTSVSYLSVLLAIKLGSEAKSAVQL